MHPSILEKSLIVISLILAKKIYIIVIIYKLDYFLKKIDFK